MTRARVGFRARVTYVELGYPGTNIDPSLSLPPEKSGKVMASFMLQGSNFEANCVEIFFQLSKTHGNEINFLEFTIEYF